MCGTAIRERPYRRATAARPWTLAVKHGERGRDGRTAKMPMEFERVVDTTGKSIEEVLIEAAADFDALIAPNFSGEGLAAERAKFLRELRDALLKHDGETLNCSGASISTEASAQTQRRRLRWLIFFCFSVVNPACRPTNLQCRPCLPKLFSFCHHRLYQFESPSSYAFPISWPAIDKRHLLSCPAPTTSNNGTIHARPPRAKKLGTWRDIWPQVVLLHQ